MERKWSYVKQEVKDYCVGMRLEKYAEEARYDEPETEEMERYILFCIRELTTNSYNGNDALIRSNKNTIKYAITLQEHYGMCYSGYCTASWGDVKMEGVSDFGAATHLPIDGKIEIDDAIFSKNTIVTIYDLKDRVCHASDIHNDLFDYSDNGCDIYYPSGYVKVNKSLFKECPRAILKRPVWIFKGDSAAGKSTLAYYLKSNNDGIFTQYETDSSSELPDEIWDNIIVIGNKYNFTVNDVKARIANKDDAEIIVVDFERR